MSPQTWVAARTLAAAIRATTRHEAVGWVWRRHPRTCPTWCARDHRCTARHGYPSGEHRSTPTTFTTGYGAITATRVQTLTGRASVELRVCAGLDSVDATATDQSRMLVAGLDLTTRAILATTQRALPVGRVAVAWEVTR
jgi:hypothetical protein